jgi:16S rRNA (cytosine967-C5)-methyltransferase
MSPHQPHAGRGSRNGRPTTARRVAYDVVAAVEESDAFANLLLPARLDHARLTPADAHLATELCYGTLRMRGYYDQVLAAAGGRDVTRLDLPVRTVLRLGAHQLLGMRVADHAAVNESVALARSVGAGRATGLVNAVLRRLAAHPASWWRREVLAGIGDPDRRLAVEYSHPPWIVEALRRSLQAAGEDEEALRRLLVADNEPAEVNLTVLPGAQARGDLQPNRYSPFGYRLASGDPRPLVAAAGGLVRVQDEGSQLVALALTSARTVRPGERWLDMCAGPGGKAALLASQAAAAGATLCANEVVPARARLVRTALEPWRAISQVTVGDGRAIGRQEPGSFDRVLLDAPCSGLGALRRRPEARWRKKAADVSELTVLQRELMESALESMKPGGILAYATCSPHLAETRDLVAKVLADRPDVRLLSAGRALARATRSSPPVPPETLMAQLWPHEHGTDGMFVAVLTKNGAE